MIVVDHTQFPSYLEGRNQGVLRDNGIQTNINLRYGEVKELILPTDVRNQNGRFIEYYVDVTGKDDFETRTTVRYQGCQLVNLFGGPGDLVRYTLRPGIVNDDNVGPGAKVLMLCIDGEQTRAIILGGVRDSFGPDNIPEGVDADDLGHNYFWQFNGAQQTVDKDGQLQFMFRGATDVDGVLAEDVDPDAEGSTLLFNKTGGIQASTPKAAQFIFLDHENKKLSILADTAWEAQVNGTLTFTVQDDVTVKTSAGVLVQATDLVTIKSAGMRVGAATDAWILGTTFRTAQAQMNSAVKNAAQSASGNLNSVASLLQTASSGLTTPAAKAAMAAAGALLSQVAAQMGAIASAIASFEGGAQTYLSTVNLSD